MAERLRAGGRGVTRLSGRGERGRAAIISTIARRRKVPDVIEATEEDPDAFLTIHDDIPIRCGRPPGVRGEQRTPPPDVLQ